MSAQSQQSNLLEPMPKENHPSSADNKKIVKRLVEAIGSDPDLVWKDIKLCLRLGDALDEGSKAKASNLIQSQSFRAYMTEDSFSAPLLVNGNEDMSSTEDQSPCSLVAARLVQVAARVESTFVISYFCGEHMPYGGDSTAPVIFGMMASLVGQLVTQMPDKGTVDMSFLDEQSWKGLSKMKLRVLCTIFEELARQIPRDDVLVCILDELNMYETGFLRQYIGAVVRRLTRLTKRRDGVVFKLLVTSRGRALDITQYFTGNVMQMDESVEADDSSAWQIANLTI
ncbi:hypothetical protein EDB81DRAFT_885331 [Dactylonectria macrodidyma]|uniref:Uncharacterized protein n=1 Tax=Dactylonectria macrodidyma TaxID=307937 RepID=A0A9P9EMX9_9HYPO|nr:hypothetical protein EDB81DRAFT_885331 [Dactylonectria macrodidyma]